MSNREEIKLLQKTKEILGENNLERLNFFWNEKEGWYFGNGEILSEIAVINLNYFCIFTEKIPYIISIFMGHEGSLEILWRNENHQLFDIEFYKDRIEYYLEVIEEEETIKIDEFDNLIKKINELLCQ